MYTPEIQLTADGSHTLFVPHLNEHYHSINGAIQESKHVYIDAGLNQCVKIKPEVLEFGFGTGLNALLTCYEANINNKVTRYTTIEKYPLNDSIYSLLNYEEFLPEDYASIFRKIHGCNWETQVNISPYFSMRKICADFSTFQLDQTYDVVYYDAFAPDKQSEAWSPLIFDRLYDRMNPGGVLTTYCAKGEIRRRMIQAGFEVERIPGPPGKRQMLRAFKASINQLPDIQPQKEY